MYAVQFLIASGFYSGRLPISGTAGSILAYLIWYFGLSNLSLEIQLIVIVGGFFIGIIVSDAVIKNTQDSDPAVVVWDEFIGSWISCLALPKNGDEGYWILFSFLLFRLFDILKPFPAGWADKQLSGGVGVMLDDVFAGIYALIIIQIAMYFYPSI